MARRSIGALAVSLVLLVSAVALADEIRNGDVLVGTRETGPPLSDPARVEPLLVAIDTPYEVFANSGTFVHVAAWLPDGTPAEGARVYLSSELVGRTDAHGTLVFRWGVSGAEVESYWVSGSSVNVRYEHHGTTYGGSVWFNAMSRTESFASDHVFVYADRGVYNPGQTVHVRSIAWHLAIDWTPVAGSELEYLLLDPDGRAVGGANVTTNAFGVAAADLILSEQAEEGLYTLQATYEGSEAEAQLRVERFVAPVIDIQHTLPRFLTRDQTGLDFDVTLGYFAGGEIGAADLTVDVLEGGASVWHEEERVEGAGPHHVAIEPAALDELRGSWFEGEHVQVRITARDEYGREDDVTRDLTYRTNPYVAVIERDRDAYSEGDPVELVVRLTDVERVPVRDTEVRLETTRGETLTARTDDGGTAQFSLVMRGESFDASVYLAGVDDPLATTNVFWQELQPMRSHIADAIVSENEAAPVRITFPSHFEPAESVVHLDVVDSSGSLVNAVLVPIRREGGTWIAEGELTAPSWGSMLLTLFCLGTDTTETGSAPAGGTRLGLMTEGQNLAVHPNRQLQIHLDGLPETVAPGGDWEARVRVTDADGSPVLASVGAAVVDEAVVRLKDPLEITPMDHFYNPELRVISTTGSAILTWPVVSRNWGDHQQDIALPPFPFKPGGMIAGPALARRGEDGELAEEEMEAFGAGEGGVGYGAGSLGGGGMAAAAEPGPAAMYMMAAPSDASVGGEVSGLAALEMGSGEGRIGASEAAAETPGPVVTIRTEFPETSLWAPLLETGPDGSVPLSGRMPDAITNQQLSVVASDASGGVGLTRAAVHVRQALYVRTDLPDSLLVGDRVRASVVVQNLGETDDEVRVSLSSATLRVEGMPQALAVPAGGTVVAQFDVEAGAVGDQEVTASARGATADDHEIRAIHVRPRGEPSEAIVEAERVGDGWQAEVDVPRGGQLTTVTLNVAFPAVTSAFAGLDALRDELATADPMGMGGELIATALLYEYWRREGSRPEEELHRWRQDLERVLSDLLVAQRPDGGWGFWWSETASPYLTGYVVEALLTLQGLDMLVPRETLEGAVAYLVGSLGEDGTWDMGTIAFWEGNDDAVRLGLTAELFEILASVPEPYRNGAWRPLMQQLGERFEGYLDDTSPEVMAYANAVLGLYRLSEAGVVSVSRERLVAAARRLNDLREEGHWEPSWFNAYGGTIEATAAALEVLDALHVEVGAVEQRELVRHLLSTRDGWGGWHNPRGTAAAIEALLRLAPPSADAAGWVRVYVGERLVRELALDPADPFLSAVELRALDLTGEVEPGENLVRVVYDGGLEPEVRAIVRHWGEASSEEGERIALEASLESAELAVGGLTELVLDVRSTTSERAEVVKVTVAAPANAVIDPSSLASLRERGLVSMVDETEAGVVLYLELEPEARRELRLRLQAVRSGEAAMPAVTAEVLGGGDSRMAVAAIERPVVVE